LMDNMEALLLYWNQVTIIWPGKMVGIILVLSHPAINIKRGSSNIF